VRRLRLFIALEVSPEVRERLVEAQRAIAAADAAVKWVRRDNIHLTVKFIGETDQAVVPEICGILERAAAAVEAFSYSVESVGTFPKNGPPRVIWAGVREGAGPIVSLYGGVNDSLRRVGVQYERRRFVPHITLGRVRARRGLPPDFHAAVDSFRDRVFGVCAAREALLIASELTRKGPIYTPLHRAPLGAG